MVQTKVVLGVKDFNEDRGNEIKIHLKCSSQHFPLSYERHSP